MANHGKMAKVDVYAADKTLYDRIAEFLQCNVKAITLRTRYNKRIAAYETILEEKKRPDKVWISEDAKAEAIAAVEKDLADLRAEFKRHMDAQARFQYTSGDEVFYNKYANATCDMHIQLAFVEWAAFYNLKVENTDLCNRVIKAVGGRTSTTPRQKVNGGKCNRTRQKNDVLKVMYGEVADYMVEKGLTLPMQFDDDIKAAYAPKKRNRA